MFWITAQRLRLGPQWDRNQEPGLLSDPFVPVVGIWRISLPPCSNPSFTLSSQSLLYKKVNEAQYRSHLANEMMMYHMKVRLA